MIKQTVLYALAVWTSSSVENNQKLFRLQKHAARVVLDADAKTKSLKLFKKSGWLPLYWQIENK